MKKKIALLLTIVTLILSFCGCSLLFEEKAQINGTALSDDIGLAVHFIDVGQGDSILIESKGEFALIDGGEYKEKDKLIGYLDKIDIDSISYVFSTHPHSDHCGGLSEVIRNYSCGTLVYPDVLTESNTWEHVLDAADERGVAFLIPKPGDVFQVGSASITVFSPSTDSIYSSLNDYSIVCKVEYGNTSLLLTGDAEKIVEKELLRSGYDLEADVYKCGHHGSSTSNSDAFLDAVNPSAAIISCGKGNDYGHPHQEVRKALKDRDIPVWRTDESGTIVMYSDGENISIGPAGSDAVEITKDTHNPSDSASYIGNKNSKVFHKEDCVSVQNTKEKNKVYFESRDAATNQGFTPCKECKP